MQCNNNKIQSEHDLLSSIHVITVMVQDFPCIYFLHSDLKILNH